MRVKTAKQIMVKALEAGTDPHLGFLDFRNTPTEGVGTSPAQRLFGRRTKTLLPTAGRLLNQADTEITTQLLQARKDKQSSYYNNGSKPLQPLLKGDTVRIKPVNPGQRWAHARVNGSAGIRSYQVTTEDGRVYRRNRRHLRLTAESPAPQTPEAELHTPECYSSPPRQIEQPLPDHDLPTSAVDNTHPGHGTWNDAHEVPPVTPVKCSSSGRVLRRPAYLNDYTS